MKQIAIVGATSSIAEHCARIWAETPAEFVLIGRSREKLERTARDLQVRRPACKVRMAIAEFNDAYKIGEAVKGLCTNRKFDIVLIAHGHLPDQELCQGDITALKSELEINGLSPVLFAEAFAAELEKNNKGTIALISSVAGDRGRKSNYVYGAAKSLINTYAEGLRHRFAQSPIRVVIIKPGPTQTPMTYHLQSRWPGLAPVENVARQIVAGVARGTPVIYAPKSWRFIMAVVVNTPKFIFNRLNI